MFSVPYHLEGNCQGGGLLVHLRNSITEKLLKTENRPAEIEAIFIKMNVKSKKMLL